MNLPTKEEVCFENAKDINELGWMLDRINDGFGITPHGQYDTKEAILNQFEHSELDDDGRYRIFVLDRRQMIDHVLGEKDVTEVEISIVRFYVAEDGSLIHTKGE